MTRKRQTYADEPGPMPLTWRERILFGALQEALTAYDAVDRPPGLLPEWVIQAREALKKIDA